MTPLRAVNTSAVEEPPLGMEMPDGQTTGDAPKKPIDAPLAKIVTPPEAVMVPEMVGEIKAEDEILVAAKVPPERVGELTVEEAKVPPDTVGELIVTLFNVPPEIVGEVITALL
jgi:hypothetical protein